MMYRDDTSPSVYIHDDKFDVNKSYVNAKMDAQMEELNVLINNGKRSSSRRHSSDMLTSYHLRQGHIGIDTIIDKFMKFESSRTSPPPLASSPLDVRHLR